MIRWTWFEGSTSSGTDESADRRRTVSRLLAAVVAAFIVRAVLMWLRGSYLDWDEAMYLLLARNLMEGSGPTLNGLPHIALGPFVPAITATIATLSGLELIVAQRVANAALGALTLVPVWYLVRLSSGERIAWIAASLLVAWPALIDVAPKHGPMWFHMYAGSEPTFLFFLFSSLACAEFALRKSGGFGVAVAALAGACLAFAYLSRAEALVFGGLYVVVRCVHWLRQSHRRQDLYALSAAALAFLLFAGPHLYYLRNVSETWLVSGQTPVMGPAAETLQEAFRDDRYLENFVRTWYRLDAGHTHHLNPYWGTPIGVSPELQRQQFAGLASSEAPTSRGWSSRVANRSVNYLYMLWVLSGPLFLPLIIVGLLAARKRELPAFATAAFSASVVTSLYLAVLPRFYLYLVPVLALWTAYGIDALVARIKVRPIAGGRVAAAALIVASFVLVGHRAVGNVARDLSLVGYTDQGVGEVLASALPDDEPVMHWHPRFAYWAGWPWRTMPIASLDAVAHYASVIGVKYVLIARGGYAPLRPGDPYFLVILDRQLRATLKAWPNQNHKHLHPPMVLRSVDPVAGYPAAALELDSKGTK